MNISICILQTVQCTLSRSNANTIMSQMSMNYVSCRSLICCHMALHYADEDLDVEADDSEEGGLESGY